MAALESSSVPTQESKHPDGSASNRAYQEKKRAKLEVDFVELACLELPSTVSHVYLMPFAP
jgi:hypothetical protein